MAKPRSVNPVKLLVAVLWKESGALHHATENLIRTWGEIDFTGLDHAFDISNWLGSKKGFLVVPSIITEPAVGYGLAGA